MPRRSRPLTRRAVDVRRLLRLIAPQVSISMYSQSPTSAFNQVLLSSLEGGVPGAMKNSELAAAGAAFVARADVIAARAEATWHCSRNGLNGTWQRTLRLVATGFDVHEWCEGKIATVHDQRGNRERMRERERERGCDAPCCLCWLYRR